MPPAEPIAYDYVYEDIAPLEEEIDEWFVYTFRQLMRLTTANQAFDAAWNRTYPPTAERSGTVRWDGEGEEVEKRKMEFVKELVNGVRGGDKALKSEAVGALMYLVLGRWMESVKGAASPNLADGKARSAATWEQLSAMREGVRLLTECGGIEAVWDALKDAFNILWGPDTPSNIQLHVEELLNLMTIMYVLISEALDSPLEMAFVRDKLRKSRLYITWR